MSPPVRPRFRGAGVCGCGNAPEGKGAGAPRHRLPDPPHAQNTRRLPPTRVPMKAVATSLPITRLHHRQPFRDPPHDGKDQGQHHVGGVIGHHAGGVRNQHPALARRGDVDMVNARAIVGDQLQLRPGLREHRGIDMVGDAGHQHIGAAHRSGQRLAVHARVGFASSTSNNSFIRCSTTSGNRRVTTTLSRGAGMKTLLLLCKTSLFVQSDAQRGKAQGPAGAA